MSDLKERALKELQPLTDGERLTANEQAIDVVFRALGHEPKREQFTRPMPLKPNRVDYENNTISRYPAWVTNTIGAVMLIVFIASAMPSLFRLYYAGRLEFLGTHGTGIPLEVGQEATGINDNVQASITGVSTFLLAEFLTVLSTLAMNIYFKGKGRLIFIVPILLGLAMALVGNYTIVQPHSPFSWLETVAPPISVLFIALVGEKIILQSIKTRHSNEQAFQTALNEWKQSTSEQSTSEETAWNDAYNIWYKATSSPQESDRYPSAYANALKQTIIKVNSTGRGKTERENLISQLSGREWKALVDRELNANNWFTDKKEDMPTITPVQTYRVPELAISSNGNGNHQDKGYKPVSGFLG